MRRILAAGTLCAAGLLAIHCWAQRNESAQVSKKGTRRQTELNTFCVSVFQPDGSEDRWKLQTTEPLTPIPGPETQKAIQLALESVADTRHDADLKLAARSVAYHLEPVYGPRIRRRPGDWGDKPGGRRPPTGYDCSGAKKIFDENQNFLGCIAGTFNGCYICVPRG